MPTTVLLVGCCEVDYLGFSRITAGSDIEIAIQPGELDSLLPLISRQRFDVVALDTHCGTGTLLEWIQTIRSLVPEQVILLVAVQENQVLFWRAASQGALGCVLKSEPAESILQRFREAANKQGGWSREELRRMSVSSSSMVSCDGCRVALTLREREVLQRLIMGGTNKQIAQGLGVSYETVKEHIQHILFKVGVTDRSQAAIWAVKKQAI